MSAPAVDRDARLLLAAAEILRERQEHAAALEVERVAAKGAPAASLPEDAFRSRLERAGCRPAFVLRRQANGLFSLTVQDLSAAGLGALVDEIETW